MSDLPSNESPGLLCFCRQHFYSLRLARFGAACHRAALLICCLDAARFGPNEAMWRCQQNTDQTRLWTELVSQEQRKRWIREEKKKVKNVISASGFVFFFNLEKMPFHWYLDKFTTRKIPSFNGDSLLTSVGMMLKFQISALLVKLFSCPVLYLFIYLKNEQLHVVCSQRSAVRRHSRNVTDRVQLCICLNQKNNLLPLKISPILGSTAKCCDKKNERLERLVKSWYSWIWQLLFSAITLCLASPTKKNSPKKKVVKVS